ncbi:hypothetical protein BV898_12003 [Hypsibius exemplaris]|uniref:Uncharacterized protein n=1 Tax=Hypsibius exemplaris TaxID=2072580 RepID=A0A1W0WF01_HYPEX|nr:hypothetical protein BV898_12003 [Hypsibius exemplaris]
MIIPASRLCISCGNVFQRVVVFRSRLPITGSSGLPQMFAHRAASSVTPVEDSSSPAVKDEKDDAIQYSTSKAFLHRVLEFDKEDPRPKHERKIVVISVVCFMIYFFVLREENDLDREMRKPLWERVPGLERQTLTALIEYNKKNGKNNALAEARLAEIIAEEAAGTAPSFKTTRELAAKSVVVAGKPIA